MRAGIAGGVFAFLGTAAFIHHFPELYYQYRMLSILGVGIASGALAFVLTGSRK